MRPSTSDVLGALFSFLVSTVIATVILMFGLSLLHVAAGFWGCLLVVYALVITIRIGADK